MDTPFVETLLVLVDIVLKFVNPNVAPKNAPNFPLISRTFGPLFPAETETTEDSPNISATFQC